ncbi:hypothetical protein F6455_10170 [Proteobacteria bacterium 005FR1]|nr:hypothetical protein [Proteobacteria bacterium 005FR1]
MNLSARDLIDAKEATSELLEQLGLDAYIFEVEPNEGPWEVHVECAHSSGWQTVAIAVDRERLLASRSNEADRQALLDDWRERLSACRRSPPDDAPH